jgi:hypothetical protein
VSIVSGVRKKDDVKLYLVVYRLYPLCIITVSEDTTLVHVYFSYLSRILLGDTEQRPAVFANAYPCRIHSNSGYDEGYDKDTEGYMGGRQRFFNRGVSEFIRRDVVVLRRRLLLRAVLGAVAFVARPLRPL